jgi:hypothetical protein
LNAPGAESLLLTPFSREELSGSCGHFVLSSGAPHRLRWPPVFSDEAVGCGMNVRTRSQRVFVLAFFTG